MFDEWVAAKISRVGGALDSLDYDSFYDDMNCGDHVRVGASCPSSSTSTTSSNGERRLMFGNTVHACLQGTGMNDGSYRLRSCLMELNCLC